MNRVKGYLPAVVFSLLFALYLLVSIQSPFASKGESREGLVVKDMIEQHDLILPLRNGVDIPSKPPLFHWVGVYALRTLGLPPESSIRFPSVLAASMGATLFFIFVFERFGSARAWLSLLLLVTSVEWARSASLARVDMMFSFALFGSFLVLVRFIERRAEWFWGALLLGGFLALAVLTKGPAGLGIPIAFGVVSWLVVYRSLRDFPIRSAFVALFVALVGAGSWYVLAYLHHGQAFLDVHLMRENVARLMGTEGYVVGHRKPFYFATINLLIAFLPWSLLLFVPMVSRWRERKKGLWDVPLVLNLLWMLTVLLVFSVSTSKRTVYLLPAMPALALILSSAVDDFSKNHSDWLQAATRYFLRGLGIVLLSASLLLLCPWCFETVLPETLREKPMAIVLASVLPEVRAPMLLLALSAVGVLLLSFERFVPSIRRAVFGAALFGVVVNVVLGVSVQPFIADANSPRVFMSQVAAVAEKGEPIYQFQHDFYPALFYSNRDLGRALMSTDPLPGRALFLVQEQEWSKFREIAPDATIVLVSDGYAVDGEDRLFLVRREPAPVEWPAFPGPGYESIFEGKKSHGCS